MGADHQSRSIKAGQRKQGHGTAGVTVAAADRWRRVRTIAVVVGWLALTACLAAAAAGDQPDRRRDGAVYDRWGRVVFSPTDGRLSYGRQAPAQDAELPWQRAQHPQTRSVKPHRLPGAKVSTTESPLEVAWTYRELLGANLGTGGLTIADIDNDGLLEVIAGTSAEDFAINDTLLAVELGPAGGYQVSWMLGPVGEISSVLAGDSNNNGAAEIYVGLRSGEVLVLDGLTREELTVLDDGTGPATGLLIGDADNDGSDEIVVCHPTETFVYDGATRTLQRRLVYGGGDLALGDVDDDGQLELVLDAGQVIEVQCGTSCTSVLEWQLSDRFGDQVALADADADGTPDIIGLASTGITAWRMAEETPIWQVPTTADSLAVADVTGDGVAEILYGDREWGAIHCLDATTTSQLWQIDNPKHGVSGLWVADVNLDGELEVVWAAGHSSTEADTLLVADAGDQSIDWQAVQTDGGPFAAVAVGDSDDDGELEIVFASTEAAGGYGDGIVHLLDAGTHQLETASTPASFNGAAWGGITTLAIGDVNDDTETEIVVTTSKYHHGAVYLLDGGTLQTEWSSVFDSGAVTSVAIGDVDNDGVTELVLGSAAEAQADEGGLIGVLRGFDGVGEWQWTGGQLDSTVANVIDLAIGNLDGDSTQEIVAVRDRLWVLQSGTVAPEWQSTDTGYRAVDLADVDGGAGLEIVAARGNGEIVILRYDTGSYVEVARFQASSSAVTAVSGFRSATNDGRVAFISDGSLAGLDASTGLELWRSDQLGAAFWPAALATAPIAGDTGTLFLVGSRLRITQYGGVTEPSRLRLQTHAYTVNEDGGVVNVVVERLGSSAGAISVDWATVPGSAVSPDDYIHQSASKSWADGVSGGLIAQVPIADDQTAEASERFWVKLANPSGEFLVIEPPFIAEVTIEDEDACYLQLETSSISATEATGSVLIDVLRSGNTAIALNAPYETSDGTATAPADYTAQQSQTCNFGIGDAICTISIPIVDDADDEGDESFLLSLLDPGTAGILLDPKVAEITISNDDHVTLSLSSGSYTVREDDGPASFTIERSGTAWGEVAVDYATADDTAGSSDYTSISGTATWNHLDSTPKTFNVPITDDADDEDDESFIIHLSNPTHVSRPSDEVSIGASAFAATWILDDESRTVSVDDQQYTVNEESGSVDISVLRAGEDTAEISVGYELADGSATAPDDYPSGVSGRIVWQDQDTDAKVVTLSVAASDDSITEGHESFLFRLLDPLGCNLDTPAEHEVVILDDEWQEFQVNVTAASYQNHPTVATAADGSFIVAWQSWSTVNSCWEVITRRFAADGTPTTGELVVASPASPSFTVKPTPAVAMNAAGKYVVTWVESGTAACPASCVNYSLYDADGTLRKTLRASNWESGTLTAPAVAIDDQTNPSFMVVWQGPGAGFGDAQDVFGRACEGLYGMPVTSVRRINQTPESDQDSPAIAALSAGGFSVVWECFSVTVDSEATCNGVIGFEGVMFRYYSSTGVPGTDEIAVTMFAAEHEVHPAVAATGEGSARDRFILAWEADDGSGSGIKKQLWVPFIGSWYPSGNVIDVNLVSAGYQTNPSVSSDIDGIDVVTWEGPDDWGLGVLCRVEDDSWELVANTHSRYDQDQPCVARSDFGNFVIVWTSESQDGSNDGIYGVLRPAGAGNKIERAPGSTRDIQRTSSTLVRGEAGSSP